MKSLNGRELASFIKERQASQVANLPIIPKLLIVYDNDSPVIAKYINLKLRYGEDIGVTVEAYHATDSDDAATKLKSAANDPAVHGIIIQLPISDPDKTDYLISLIPPSKDVDGLGLHAHYDSATATAILWLLAGYDIKLPGNKIALVGRGKLVGAPLYRMFQASSYDVTLFHRGSDLANLKNFDIIISATGVPGLISNDFVSPGAILVDAGIASENGIIKGDFSEALYTRTDLAAITPVIGGVGPLTIACLFDHLIQATDQ